MKGRERSMKVKTVYVKDKENIGLDRYPNFSITGNIYGMKRKYYGEDALLVRCGSWIYKVGNESLVDKNNLDDGAKIYYYIAH